MSFFGKKDPDAKAAEKDAKKRAKGNGVANTEAGRRLAGIQAETDRIRRNNQDELAKRRGNGGGKR